MQIMNESKSHCSFVISRFGNVFNSEGSVFPIFERQIQREGPITLTHTEMTRYFMSVSEASTFLLESAIVRYSGDILFYDMGEPIKILDLARKMIETFSPKGVEIEIVGLRPEEKIHEEIMIADG